MQLHLFSGCQLCDGIWTRDSVGHGRETLSTLSLSPHTSRPLDAGAGAPGRLPGTRVCSSAALLCERRARSASLGARPRLRRLSPVPTSVFLRCCAPPSVPCILLSQPMLESLARASRRTRPPPKRMHQWRERVFRSFGRNTTGTRRTRPIFSTNDVHHQKVPPVRARRRRPTPSHTGGHPLLGYICCPRILRRHLVRGASVRGGS